MSFQVILGLIKPNSGSVVVRSNSAIPGPGVGVMPQNIALHLYFSVAEILHYYSLLAGLKDQERRDKQETILSFLNLSEKCSEPVMFLSGGQQRRLSLACALMASPPLLILDEPTVGTDPVLRLSIWSALRQIAKQGTTVLLTTHYLEEAGGADCVGFLREGKILQEGNPGDLMDRFSKNPQSVICRSQDWHSLDASAPPCQTHPDPAKSNLNLCDPPQSS